MRKSLLFQGLTFRLATYVTTENWSSLSCTRGRLSPSVPSQLGSTLHNYHHPLPQHTFLYRPGLDQAVYLLHTCTQAPKLCSRKNGKSYFLALYIPSLRIPVPLVSVPMTSGPNAQARNPEPTLNCSPFLLYPACQQLQSAVASKFSSDPPLRGCSLCTHPSPSCPSLPAWFLRYPSPIPVHLCSQLLSGLPL